MYYTSSKKLFDIYSSINDYKHPDAMIHDICDKEIFKPINLNRFEYDKINTIGIPFILYDLLKKLLLNVLIYIVICIVVMIV